MNSTQTDTVHVRAYYGTGASSATGPPAAAGSRTELKVAFSRVCRAKATFSRNGLRPADARRRRVDGEHLPGPHGPRHARRRELGRHQEQRPPVRTTERAGEATPVELDGPVGLA